MTVTRSRDWRHVLPRRNVLDADDEVITLGRFIMKIHHDGAIKVAEYHYAESLLYGVSQGDTTPNVGRSYRTGRALSLPSARAYDVGLE